jgi:leucyl-tRNA synthetase
MKNYDHIKIEKKWQKEWDKNQEYKTLDNSRSKKMYVLDMFPYPSGVGLHVGHPRGYIGSDVYARMKRMEGYNVLHPMGYDAFGLPAEQYALQHKIHPKKAVEENVKTFERQLSIIGLSYDWTRKVNTTDPKYYKWTEWIFLQIYNSWYDNKKNKARPISELELIFKKSGNAKVNASCNLDTEIFTAKSWSIFSKKEKQDILMKYRLAYEGHSEVNWCPSMGTVLANDEIINDSNGNPVSERGGYPIEKKLMRQWFMRITAYADRLLTGLDGLEWSDHIKEIQKNWIGRSEGSEIEFKIRAFEKFSSGPRMREDKGPDRSENIFGGSHSIKIFTTRADTIFGATYVVLAPEHPLIKNLESEIKNLEEVNKYITSIKNKTDEDRIKNDKEKTGVELIGITAINPANHKEIPVWTADYVLASYGTGAVMAVPAHDERDFEFAKKYNLNIKQSVMPVFGSKTEGEEIRYAVSAFVKRPSDGKYLFIKAKEFNHISKVYGGIEEGENAGQAGVREVFEETGFKTRLVSDFGYSIQSHFYHPFKKINRRLISDLVLLELIDDEQYEIDEEESLLHEVVWLTLGEAKKLITEPKELHDFEILEGKKCFIEDGIVCNSDNFSGISSYDARKKITEFVGGKNVSKYKMRDAIFARQRYWGEPIPLRHDKEGIISQIKEKDLPLELPNVKSYISTGTGESPLAGVKSWVKDGYETNTMPGWAGSSWYFLRYMDPQNTKNFASKKSIDYWKNVDVYVGGQEHATGHLLYSRFWNNFLYDIGCVPFKEPFKRLKNQGMILATDGRKMSKRWNNVVNPDDIVKNYGADTLRIYEMFMGPFEQSLPWSTESIIGSRRFIDRVYRLQTKINNIKSSVEVEKIIHKTLKKVTEDIENFAFNTAVSSMMILINEIEKSESIGRDDFKIFLQMLAPFAPHITEELWYEMEFDTDSGHSISIHKSPWPKWDKKKIIDDMVKIAVQVNGKVRAEIMISKDMTEADIKEMSLKDKNIISWIGDSEIKRVIYVQNRIINIVI